ARRRYGLYPRKGALAIGSDADIVLLDPRAGRVIRKEDLHETDYTPWGRPRGGDLAEHDDPARQDCGGADGQFLPRKIGDEIRARPAVRVRYHREPRRAQRPRKW